MARTAYVFRLFDLDDNKVLDKSEVGRLIYEARKLKKESVDKQSLETASQALYSGLKLPFKAPLTQENLVVSWRQLYHCPF